MKRLLALGLFVMMTSSAFAELRNVAISCNAIVKKDGNTRTITGFQYSLHTGSKEEEVKDVTLKELLPKLKEVAWAGSVIQVSIFSDYGLSAGTLKSLLDGIEANPHMELIYLENGKTSKMAEHIKKIYNL